MKLGLLLVLAFLVMGPSLSEGYRRQHRQRKCKAVYIAIKFYYWLQFEERPRFLQMVKYCFHAKPQTTTSAPNTEATPTPPLRPLTTSATEGTTASLTQTAKSTAKTQRPHSTSQITANPALTAATTAPLSPSTSTGTSEQTPVAIGRSTASTGDPAASVAAGGTGLASLGRRRRSAVQSHKSDDEEEFQGQEDDFEGLWEDYDSMEEDAEDEMDRDEMTEYGTRANEDSHGRVERGVRRSSSKKCLYQRRCVLRVIREF